MSSRTYDSADPRFLRSFRNKKNILLVGGIFILGLILGMMSQSRADFSFTYDLEDNFLFQSDVLWPQEIIDEIALIEGVEYAYNTPTTTIIGLNLTQLGLEEKATIEYIKALDYKFANNKYGSVTYPGIFFPQCTFDYGTNQKVGMYVFNGGWVAVQNDSSC